MKVTDYLEEAAHHNKTLISFEIVPPERGGSLGDIVGIVEGLIKYEPPFIDITSHSAEIRYLEKSNTIEKKVRKRRPGTLGICSLVQQKYDIDAVPHVLCSGFTREETEDFLIDINFMEINNVLVLRGDSKKRKNIERTSGKSLNQYPIDLVKQIKDMNNGTYLDGGGDRTSFCVGVAAYPEKHPESPNIETDLIYLKEKIDAGADYIVTQMCFDNNVYFRFLERCRENDIDVPILPGIKIVANKKQLNILPRIFNVDIPYELSSKIEMAEDKDEVEDISVRWAEQQIKGYINDGRIPGVHIFVIDDIKLVKRVMDNLKNS